MSKYGHIKKNNVVPTYNFNINNNNYNQTPKKHYQASTHIYLNSKLRNSNYNSHAYNCWRSPSKKKVPQKEGSHIKINIKDT